MPERGRWGKTFRAATLDDARARTKRLLDPVVAVAQLVRALDCGSRVVGSIPNSICPSIEYPARRYGF